MATPEAIQSAKSQSGLDQKTLDFIKQKAETGVQMDTSTPQKQAVYDAYQNYYIDQIKQKAGAGQSLEAPNAWKDSIYNQYNGTQAPTTVDSFLTSSQNNSATQMQSLQDYLTQASQAQSTSQQAQLALARDQQLAEIDKALQTAIANGELSIRQAKEQFEEAKKSIQNQSYTDSEMTNLTAHDRGIQNSAQMIGLMQGDQARANSLMSTSMTERDRAINEINNQLTNLKYSADVDRTMANNQYNYGLAGGQAEIQANLMNQIANMSFEEFQRMQSQGFDLFNTQLNQQYAQENMQTAHGFDMQKLNQQQKYTLEQMAKQQGFDLQKMSIDQQYSLAQMAQSYGYDMSLQSSNQNFQAGQNALDRNAQVTLQSMRQSHDLSMLSAEQKAQADTYELELGRKLAQYQPGTREHSLLTSEFEFALQSMQKESSAQIASELGATQLASLLESYPKTIPDVTDKKAVDKYNAQVEALNAQVTKLLGSAGGQYTMDKLKASGKTQEEKAGFLDFLKGGLKLITPITTLP